LIKAPRDTTLAVKELAGLILNLDEAIMKQ